MAAGRPRRVTGAARKAPARSSTDKPPSKRDAARDRRRAELIAATIKCIARSGLAGVTMQEITREAGLSLGIVNLHFDTKERLLIETLRVIADEYRAGWRRVLESKRGAAERLAALVKLDFSAGVVERGKLAVWFAYWGETRARQTYRRICADVDQAIDEELCELCSELVAEGAYKGVNPHVVATTYSALTNGLWLDLLVCPEVINRGAARGLCQEYLGRVFPRHAAILNPRGG